MNTQPLTSAIFDIECTSADGTFPQAQNNDDKIIQIATVFKRSGEANCYYKHLVLLEKKCNSLNTNIENYEVESFESEQEVLLEWIKIMERMNPDVLTNFNMNRTNFDLDYLKDRVKKLGIEKQFSKLISKLIMI